MKVNTDEKKIEKFLSRNLEEIITLDEFKKKIKEKKQLRIKYGVDVTNPMLHLGHAVNLWKMRELQEMGHKVVFLIGDFTSLIGDPTGKSQTRPRRTKEEIERDAREYQKQVLKILSADKEVFEVRRNSEWYGKMKAEELLSLMSLITNARLMERDMFQKRAKEGKEIYEHEIVYPILQGYDSVMLKSDLTIIGSDQLFNEMVGRVYQEKFSQEPQIVMTTTITPGTDGGEKMSKSIGNFVAIMDSPREKFGKLMSIPDNLIVQYLKVYTQIPLEEVVKTERELKDGANPRDAKLKLAYEIVKLYHGEKVSNSEHENFIKTFSKKEIPEEIKEVKVKSKNILDVLVEVGFCSSKGEARRNILQGGVTVSGEVVKDFNFEVKPGDVIKKGKRHFVRVK